MLFKEKILYSRSVSKQRNKKTLSTVIHSLKETRQTRFGGIKHSWRQIKATQALFNKKDNFSQMKLGLLLTLVMLRTSAFNIRFFTLSVGQMVTRYPIPNGFQRDLGTCLTLVQDFFLHVISSYDKLHTD